MSEYRITSVDIPWAKHYSPDYQLTLQAGVGAIIPNPEGDGFMHLSHDQYRTAMGELAWSASAETAAPSSETPPHIQGFINLRHEVSKGIVDGRIEYHSESDQRQTPAEGEIS